LRQLESHRASQEKLKEVDTKQIQQKAAIFVKQFFAQVRRETQGLKADVKQRIKNSDSLKELESVLVQPAPQVQNDHLTLEKEKFDKKLQDGRYNFVVKREKFYKDLISTIDIKNQKMQMQYRESEKKLEQVLKIKN
jgi:molybdopterin converting factor small subunit